MTGSLHILLVEDDEIVVGLIEHTLAAHDYQISVAGDGEAAWDLLQGGGGFDAILLDRGLPKLDGLALLKRVKSDASLRHVPVVIETAQGDMECVREGIDAGAYYYLTKPLYPRLLLSVLGAAIQQRKDVIASQLSVRESAQTLSFLTAGTFCCRTLAEASELANGLACVCPDPARAALGLQELLINAVEHGNLGISYAERTQLMIEDRWHEEVERRSMEPAYQDRVVTVELARDPEQVCLTIRDEGHGFAWKDYLDFSPERAFDPHGRGIAMSRMVSFDITEYQGNGNTVKVTIFDRRANDHGGSS